MWEVISNGPILQDVAVECWLHLVEYANFSHDLHVIQRWVNPERNSKIDRVVSFKLQVYCVFLNPTMFSVKSNYTCPLSQQTTYTYLSTSEKFTMNLTIAIIEFVMLFIIWINSVLCARLERVLLRIGGMFRGNDCILSNRCCTCACSEI